MRKSRSFYIFFLIGISLFSFKVYGQGKQIKVLFIGNSYTYYNNLPDIINQLAVSTGDQVTYSSNTPGGYTFQGHFSNTTTLNLIAQGDWDFVVLQEQSQMPSFSDASVELNVFPYAKKLDSLVKKANPCTKTVFYMTWGRKNGDQPNCWTPTAPSCTYEGMDDRLKLNYTKMADRNDALLCPVGEVWRALRTNHSSIELYNPDESHPSLAGSYAAACAFYTLFFKKDPELCTYISSLTSAEALTIRTTASNVVYDQLSSYYSYLPVVAPEGCSEVTTIQQENNFAERYEIYTADDLLYIPFEEKIEKLSVLNSTGQLVLEAKNVYTPGTIEIKNLTTGIYYVKMYAGKNMVYRKFYKD